MRFRTLSTFVVAIASCVIAASCASDSPTEPQTAMTPTAAPSENLLSTLLGKPVTVVGLKRTTALASNQSVSATIGVLGGRLTLPNAGFTVIVPPLAIIKPTKITVTALAGQTVAYEFQPAGIRFTLPLVATQDLRKTEAARGGLINPLSLQVGYFPDAKHITSVTELLSLQVDLLGQTSIATIWHFSGYMWASGRSAR